MIRFFIAVIIAVGILTVINISLINWFYPNTYVMLAIYLLNIATLVLISNFYKQKEKAKEYNKLFDEVVSEKSVAVFIKVLIYLLPIVALIGLYFVSIIDNNNVFLGIEDANSWVSFILGIAAFSMSLITLWQSEGTYNKIFDALDELRKKTDDIKRNTDITEALRTQNIGLKSDIKEHASIFVNGEGTSVPLSEDKNKTNDGSDIVKSAHKSPFDK